MSETTKKKVFLFVPECSLYYLKIVQMSGITKLKNDIWSIFEKKIGQIVLPCEGKYLYLQPIPKNHDNDNNYHQIKENKRLSLWCLGRPCPDAEVNVCVL